jgi:hypothetical protein
VYRCAWQNREAAVELKALIKAITDFIKKGIA